MYEVHFVYNYVGYALKIVHANYNEHIEHLIKNI